MTAIEALIFHCNVATCKVSEALPTYGDSEGYTIAYVELTRKGWGTQRTTTGSLSHYCPEHSRPEEPLPDL